MTATEFRAELAGLGLSQTSFASITSVGDRTVRRWAAGTQDIPGWVPLVLRLLRQTSGAEAAA
jgi:DNA-binding transcriptional regulator YiaG